MGYLSATTEAATPDLAAMMSRVIAQGGPGGYRQVWQIVRLRMAGHRINLDEFYTYGLWRKPAGPVLPAELLTAAHLKAFNASLLMPGRGDALAVINDKIATEVLLQSAGLRTTRTRACFAMTAPPASVEHLRDHAAICRFLTDPANLPTFGKPKDGTWARGAVIIDRLTESGDAVMFLDGTRAAIAALAEEITQDWSKGYLFQPVYRIHADLAPHTGPAMASLRIVTLLTDRGVEPWYAVLRIPARKAMHDGDHRGTRVWGLVDLANGALIRLRNLRDPVSPDIVHWLDKDRPLLGLRLPHWDQALADVVRAHGCFPGHGIIGWDVFLTDDGALINEANANPGHVYQVAAQRGLLNPDMKPAYDRALAFANAVNAASV